MTAPIARTRRAGEVAVLLVLAIIAALGALVGAYVMYARADEARVNTEATQKETRDTKAKLDKARADIQKWQQLVGVETVEEVKAKVNEFTPALIMPRNNLAGLITTLEEMRSKDQYRLMIAEDKLLKAQTDLEAARTEYETNRKIKDAELKRQQTRLSEATQELKKIESDFRNQINTFRSEQSNAKKKMRRMQEDLEEEQRRHRLEVQKLKNELSAMLEEVRAKMQEQIPEADGKILFVKAALNSATIDIGMKEGVKSGMVFKVYRRDETGERVDKGRIRVRRADADVSVAEIIDTEGSESVIPGDLLDSPLFPEGQTFCVIGIFPKKMDYPYPRWEVMETIERFGGRVVENVDLNTDFVVTGHVERYDALDLSTAMRMRGMEDIEEIQKWDLENQLGRRFEEGSEDELQTIMDDDVSRRNDAIELRTPVLTSEEFMQYVAR